MFKSVKLMFILLVAPLVGAWIEILGALRITSFKSVAPLVGAWIEILILLRIQSRFKSLLL